jgi:hypothetical protein
VKASDALSGSRRAGRSRRARLAWRQVSVVVGAALAVTFGAALPTSGANFKAATANTTPFGAESSFYSRMIKDDNPAAYYRLGEAAGSNVVADASGHNHPGTYRASPTLGVTGMSHDGDTADQTGANSWAQLPNLVSGDFSLELWFKTSATSTQSCGGAWYDCPFTLMGNEWYGVTTGNFGIAMNGDGTLYAGTADTNTTISTATAYNNGSWHHVVFTRVASTGAIKLYVDAVLKASGTGGTGADNDSYIIGLGANLHYSDQSSHPFNGWLDDVAEYTTALSSTRISAHYSARNTTYVSTVTADSPAGYWRLDDAATSGTVAARIGGAAAAGGVGGEVLHGQSGAIGDGNAAMKFVPDATNDAYVPRLVSGNFTLEVRFKTSQDSGGTGNWYSSNRIVGADAPGDTTDFGVGIGADGRVYAGTGSPDTTIVSAAGTTYNDAAWHQIDFTRTASTGALKLYVDGSLVATGTGGTAALTALTSLRIGSDAGSNRFFQAFDGVISDVAQYSTVLSSTRINAHVSAATSASAYHSSVSADSPAGYWPLNDASGTTLAALIGGASNNGYADTGPVRGVSGPTGAGIEFDVVNRSGVEVPRTFQDNFSLECWFETSSGTGFRDWWNGAPLIQADVGGSVQDFGLSMTVDGRVMFGANTGAPVVTSGAGYNDGGWHHVVLTRNGTTGAVILYLDGVQVATGTGVTGSLNAPSQVGVGYSPNEFYTFEGSMDEVAFYTTILTPAQVAAHHTRGIS